MSNVKGEPERGFWGLVGTVASLSRRLREKAFFDRGPDDFLLHGRTAGRALDIGCGAGENLAKLKRLGWNAEGVEWDPRAAQIAQETSGARVRVGDFQEMDLEEGAYDFILMNHVIEHLRDPRIALAKLRRLLSPSGVVLLRYPNPDSLGARVFGKAWFPWEVPRHLVIPPGPSLSAAAVEVGLRPIACTTEPIGARYYYAASRAIKAGKVGEGRLTTSTTDLLLETLLRVLVALGFGVGEQVRLVLKRDDGGQAE